MLCPATAVDRGSDMCDDRVVPAVGRRVSLSWDGVWYTGTVDDHRILLSRDHHSVHHVAKEFHVAYDDGTRHWQQRSSDGELADLGGLWRPQRRFSGVLARLSLHAPHRQAPRLLLAAHVGPVAKLVLPAVSPMPRTPLLRRRGVTH